jgi:predicted double-glycine peptidase
MNGYLETIAVLAVAVLGVLAGRAFGSLKRPYWLAGYVLSMALIGLLVLSRLYYPLDFIPPFSSIVAGRARFVTLCVAVTVGVITPLSRLPYRIERILVCALMAIVVAWFCVMPFLVPTLLKGSHQALKTRMNAAGICFQSTDYTCGPAAAVTALNKLGITADEGQLAVLAHSSPVTGTLPECLADAITRRYADAGVECRFRLYHCVDELKDADVSLVVVKDHFLTDHCIAVLGVNKDSVVVGDPARGREIIPRETFMDEWRYIGIAINRRQAQAPVIACGG